MASRDAERVYEGLSQVAHAIRRSTALYVAMSILPPEATIEDLKRQASELAGWIGGKALESEVSGEGKPPLGEPWPPTS